MRRLIAAAAAVVVLILLILGVRGCLDARKERSLKDYARDVSALVGESNQLSDNLFNLLADPGDQGEVAIENAFNQFRNQSAQLVERLQSTDTPDEMATAQRHLTETFEFRRDGLAAIANALPTALAPQDRRESTDDIAGQMQTFLASDVIYATRAKPSIEAVLADEGLAGEERVPDSAFLPEIDWLDPTTVADRISRISTGGGGPAAPGLHGNGLGTVALGGTALAPGGSSTIALTDDLAFEVQVQNQGENTETDVTVRVTVGEGGDAIELEEQLPEIAAGETQTVTLPLAERPPTGEQVPISVEIEPVPGEEKTDNNVGDFSAIFTS